MRLYRIREDYGGVEGGMVGVALTPGTAYWG